MEETNFQNSDCQKIIRAVQDTMYVMGGKWKISIIANLIHGKKRYSDILKEISGISGKMLSRELKDLELNQLIRRTVMNTKPITVNYELTEYGYSFRQVIHKMAQWGQEHREKIRTDRI